MKQGLSRDFSEIESRYRRKISTSVTTGTGSGRIQAFGSGASWILRDSPAAEGNVRASTCGSSHSLTPNSTPTRMAVRSRSGATTIRSHLHVGLPRLQQCFDRGFLLLRARPTFNALLGSSGVNSRFSGTGTFASSPRLPPTFSQH